MPTLKDDPAAYPRVITAGRSMSENKTGNWRSLKPVIDAKKCTGCLICWKYCPEACVGLTEKVPAVDLAFCKGCGICAAECPPEAIVLEEEAAL